MPPLHALVHNLPLATSVLAVHAERGSAKAGSVLLRALPRGLTRRVARGAGARRRPDLAALALAAIGAGDEAEQLLSRTLSGPGPAAPALAPVTRRRVAEAAVTLHRSGLAAQALQDLPQQEQDARLTALVAAGQGRLGAAVLAAGAGPDRASRRLAARLRGEVETVRGQWLREQEAAPVRVAARDPQPGRVLHVVSTALPERQSGYTIRTQGIASAQRAHGVDARVVTRLGFPVDTGVLAARPDVVVEGVPHHRLLPRRGVQRPGRGRQVQAVRELGRVVERTGAQLLHAHSMHENAQVALLTAGPLGLPVVYEARGFLEETWRTGGGSADSDFYRWSRDTETLCMHRADVVVTLSEAMRADIVGRGVDPSSVLVVPNAVPASFTDPVPPGDAVRRRWGLGPEDIVLGTVTTVNAYEGLDTVVQALALVDDPAFRLLVVGDGPAVPALQEQARRAGLQERVVFTGRVRHAEVREHLGAMDLFVLPRHETPVTRLVPPIKPLEAMAAGIPVLASDLPPLVEIVQPGRLGQVAPPGDAAAWAERITALGYAPDEVRALGERAREFVALERTWERAVDRYDEAYALAGRAGGPPPPSPSTDS